MLQPLFALTGHTRDELALAAVQFLVAIGYAVDEPATWETRSAFCARLGISRSRFKRQMRRAKQRRDVEFDRGPCGRMLKLRSTQSFDAWMKGAD